MEGIIPVTNHKIETPDDRLFDEEVKEYDDDDPFATPYTASLTKVIDRLLTRHRHYVLAGFEATITWKDRRVVTLTWTAVRKRVRDDIKLEKVAA
jgi:hypothetical protein